MSGFIDLQVNGYAGIDFNADELDLDQLNAVCQRLTEDGVSQILATVITAPAELMIERITRLAHAIDSSTAVSDVITGIHIEGPFISPTTGFVGAHPVDAVIPADINLADRILAAAAGHAKLLTLAPEQDPKAKLTRHLARQGIVVAAGHCDASIDQLDEAIDAGLGLFTHLGNGCPNSHPRHDNIITRVLSVADRIKISFIADGHHVPLFALRSYLKLVPSENIIIVSDAISAAGLGPGTFSLGHQTVTVDKDGAAWCEDRTHFAGCATKLNEMHHILTANAGFDSAEVKRWMSQNPAELLKTS